MASRLTMLASATTPAGGMPWSCIDHATPNVPAEPALPPWRNVFVVGIPRLGVLHRGLGREHAVGLAGLAVGRGVGVVRIGSVRAGVDVVAAIRHCERAERCSVGAHASHEAVVVELAAQ